MDTRGGTPANRQRDELLQLLQEGLAVHTLIERPESELCGGRAQGDMRVFRVEGDVVDVLKLNGYGSYQQARKDCEYNILVQRQIS